MERFIVEVPAGIRYLSDWPDFDFRNFYGRHIIINKQITGCGFTEFALTCCLPVVLSSPRNILMQNKKDQHGDDVYLVINRDLEELQPSLDYDPSEKKDKPEGSKATLIEDKYSSMLDSYKEKDESVYIRIRKEISEYLNYILPQGKSPKIIVTYDSTYLVKRILSELGILQNYYFVVDEFQSILDDARFKAGTELEFMNILKDIPSVMFVSATPMLDKYLEMLDEFKDLPYYSLDWGALDPGRIQKPVLKIRGMKSISGEMKRIIQSYLDGSFEKVILNRGNGLEEIESRECVIYVNSVNHIIRVIKSMGLQPDQVNILCSDTPENRQKIEKKLGNKSGFSIGRVPKRGDQHKLITMCTRTVYLGADFYSTNARSFIFSDSNADCLSIDISMDLPQILGRQRLEENPWKNHAEFYYRFTCDYKKMTQDQLMSIINKKLEETESLLRSYANANEGIDKYNLAKRYLKLAHVSKYREDYVSVDRKSSNTLIPQVNNLVRVNELRTFEIQQVDYADRFTVLTAIDNQFSGISEENDERVVDFFMRYDRLTTYIDKIRTLCEFTIQFPELTECIIKNLVDTDKVKQHFIVLGPYRIQSLGYNLTQINQALGITIFNRESLSKEIYTRFKPGDRYSKADFKSILREIYEEVGYKATPKASDIEEWFEIKRVNIQNLKTGKRDNGFELLSVK